jgi:Ca2+/Na+ antiporter
LSFEERKRLPTEYVVATLGILIAVIAVAPLIVVLLLSKRQGPRYRAHSFTAAMAAQGFNVALMFGSALVCAAVAKQQLLRFAMFAGFTMLVLQTASVMIIMRRRRRKTARRGD